MKKIIDAIPKFLLGPLAVILGIVYFTQQDPPKTICDIQFDVFREERDIKKYVFSYKAKTIKIPPEIQGDIERCENTNSPGGCFDWLQGLRRILKITRNIPDTCQDRIHELDPLRTWLKRSLFVFSQISWNDNPIVVRKGLYHWLGYDDIIMFCRLKSEYIRLVGAEDYKTTERGLLAELVKLKRLPPQQVWPRTVLSYRCPVLN